MKRIKSYTGLWNVEKVLYSVNDLQLPFPVTFTQMAWFVAMLMVVVMFGNVPPLSLIDGALLKYVGIPLGVTWFMAKKTFDGKKPYNFLRSAILYFARPKRTFAGRTVKYKKQKINEYLTIVRCENYVPD